MIRYKIRYFEKNGKLRKTAVMQVCGKYSTENMLEMISYRTLFSVSDGKIILRALSDNIVSSLVTARKVKLESLGTLYISSRSRSKENPDELDAGCVLGVTVKLRLGHRMKVRLKRMGFRSNGISGRKYRYRYRL